MSERDIGSNQGGPIQGAGYSHQLDTESIVQQTQRALEIIFDKTSSHGEKQLAALGLRGIQDPDILTRLREEGLTHSETSVRQASADALYGTSDPECQMALCQTGLRDPERHVRWASIFGLSKNTLDSTLEWLCKNGLTHEDANIRKFAVMRLEQVEEEKYIKLLQQTLQDAPMNPDLKVTCEQVLAKMRMNHLRADPNWREKFIQGMSG